MSFGTYYPVLTLLILENGLGVIMARYTCLNRVAVLTLLILENGLGGERRGAKKRGRAVLTLLILENGLGGS